MKAVILAGGLGTRISEETHLKPKPMVEIGGKPILWHIMKIFSFYDINDFIICCGYKGYLIKEYFANYFMHMSDVTFDVSNNKMSLHQKNVEPWKVTLVDTGEETMTGGRLKRVYNYIKNENEVFFTYGDGLINLDINELLKFHRSHCKMVTLTAVKPPARYGAVQIENKKVISFKEKPTGEGGFINGGYFIISPKVVKYIDNDYTAWENTPLKQLVNDNELMAFEHQDFFHPMDTLRDKGYLENLWDSGNAPWKKWK